MPGSYRRRRLCPAPPAGGSARRSLPLAWLSSSGTMSLRTSAWLASHSFTHGEFSPCRLAAERNASVSVCLPARNEAATIGPIVTTLVALRDEGVSTRSSWSTIRATAPRTSPGHSEPRSMIRSACSPNWGRCWARAMRCGGPCPCSPARSSAFSMPTASEFGPHFAVRAARAPRSPHGDQLRQGLLPAPLPGRRAHPARWRGTRDRAHRPPLLNLFYPDLAAVRQPLAGEIALRRDLLERLPFVTGYGVDIATAPRRAPPRGPRRSGPGRSRCTPERPPTAARPRADGLRRPARREPHGWSERAVSRDHCRPPSWPSTGTSAGRRTAIRSSALRWPSCVPRPERC